MLLQNARVPPFSLSCSTAVCKCTTAFLPTRLLVGTWQCNLFQNATEGAQICVFLLSDPDLLPFLILLEPITTHYFNNKCFVL